MTLTIVLTVYNKESFLRRIIKALLSQGEVNKDEFEIVIVNDGSKDNSATIIDEYAKVDSRINVLTQDNQGLSMARNNGMDFANGNYIWFVDADDDVSSVAVKLICEAAQFSPDVIPIYAQTDGIERVRNEVFADAKTGFEILLSSKWEQCGVFYVYKKSFLQDNNLRFLPGIYHEDAEFTPRMLYFAQSVKVIPHVLYTVYRDPIGITQVPRAKRAFDYLIVSEKLSQFIEEHDEKKTKIGRVIASNVAQDINNAFFIICKNSKDDQRQFNEEFYQSRQSLLAMLSIAQQKKYRVEALLFRLFPHKYVGIYKIMQMFNR